MPSRRQPLQADNPCRSRALAGRVLARSAQSTAGFSWQRTVGCRFALRCGLGRAPLCAPWALSSHTVILRAGYYFFRNTLVKNHHRSTDDLLLIHTAIHVLGHPLALGLRLDSRLCTTERGSYTEISATNSRFRTYEGVAPLWRRPSLCPLTHYGANVNSQNVNTFHTHTHSFVVLPVRPLGLTECRRMVFSSYSSRSRDSAREQARAASHVPALRVRRSLAAQRTRGWANLTSGRHHHARAPRVQFR